MDKYNEMLATEKKLRQNQVETARKATADRAATQQDAQRARNDLVARRELSGLKIQIKDAVLVARQIAGTKCSRCKSSLRSL